MNFLYYLLIGITIPILLLLNNAFALFAQRHPIIAFYLMLTAAILGLIYYIWTLIWRVWLEEIYYNSQLKKLRWIYTQLFAEFPDEWQKAIKNAEALSEAAQATANNFNLSNPTPKNEKPKNQH